MKTSLPISGLTASGQRDEFFYLCAINRASLVGNVESHLLTRDKAVRFAQAIETVTKNGENDISLRTDRVIKLEPMLIALAGNEITELHIGRSSQDMHSTYRIAMIRDDVFSVIRALNQVLTTYTNLAKTHQDTVVPNYTNGVAAQPNSLGHYLLGISEGLVRCRNRLMEFYHRTNLSPMGSTVLNGTSWPLNRIDMARRLGFEGIIENAFDATQGCPCDLPVEFAQIMQSIALQIGTVIQDIMVQYAQPRPWMILAEGSDTTYVSSAMPQKRNPGLMNNTRALASSVVSGAVEMSLLMHNLMPGMQDAKNVKNRREIANKTIQALTGLNKILCSLRINPERALEELNNDWTATQEVADVLMREHGMPFRVGHHVASEMVSYARANNISPMHFPYEKMQEICLNVTSREWHATEFPLSEEKFFQTLNPRQIVAHRQTLGGPQPQSLSVLFARREESNKTAQDWLQESEQKVLSALLELEHEFSLYSH